MTDGTIYIHGCDIMIKTAQSEFLNCPSNIKNRAKNFFQPKCVDHPEKKIDCICTPQPQPGRRALFNRFVTET